MLTISMLLTDVMAGSSLAATLPFPAATAAGSVSSQDGQSTGNSTEQSPGFENPFGDVSPDDWFFDDVGFVFTSGLMNATGTETPMFSPYLSMSRVMLVTVLYRLAGSPDTSGLSNTFIDVPEDTWYSSAVVWAAANGITNGMGGNRLRLTILSRVNRRRCLFIGMRG